MSEKQQHKRRYNRKLEFIAHYEKWLESEPPMVRVIAWHVWKRKRPMYHEEVENAPD